MNKILITRKVPQPFVKQLERIGNVVMWDKELTPMPREAFLEEIKDATACLSTLSERIDEEVLKEASNLKVIANMAVGYDNIDVNKASQYGITVTNTPHVLTETTAELGFTLMLTVARNYRSGNICARRPVGKLGTVSTFRQRCLWFNSWHLWYGRYW